MSDAATFAAAIDAAIVDTAYAEAIAAADIIATAVIAERELVAAGIFEASTSETFALVYESLKSALHRIYAQVKFSPDATPATKANLRGQILAQAANEIAAYLKARAAEQEKNARLANQDFRG